MTDNEEEMVDAKIENYRFIDYRLDQLEIALKTGLSKIEVEQKENNAEIMHMLQTLQEGQNEQNKNIIELQQRQAAVEKEMVCIEKLKEAATKNSTRLTDIERRMEIYKQVLFILGTGVVLEIVTRLLHIL